MVLSTQKMVKKHDKCPLLQYWNTLLKFIKGKSIKSLYSSLNEFKGMKPKYSRLQHTLQ